MATRFYFNTDTFVAEPKPNAPLSGDTISQFITMATGGGQDGSGTIYPNNMTTTPGTVSRSFGSSLTEPGAAHYVCFKSFISPALAAQTITGTFSLVLDLQEGNAAQNMNPRILIYVWKADDSGVRGTLYAIATSTLEANLTIGTLQTFTFASYTLSDLAISAGDRIVVELETYDNNTKTASYNHLIGLNGAVASGYESYIEFSMDIAWLTADQFMDQII